MQIEQKDKPERYEWRRYIDWEVHEIANAGPACGQGMLNRGRPAESEADRDAD